MAYKYEKQFSHKMKLSQNQLDQMSALQIMGIFMDNNKFENIELINQRWANLFRMKNGFSHFRHEELKKTGISDCMRYKTRKTKKGYVVEMRFNWRSKGVETTEIKCVKCEKLKLLNHHQFCEDCTREVGGSKGIYKFWNKKLWGSN